MKLLLFASLLLLSVLFAEGNITPHHRFKRGQHPFDNSIDTGTTVINREVTNVEQPEVVQKVIRHGTVEMGNPVVFRKYITYDGGDVDASKIISSAGGNLDLSSMNLGTGYKVIRGKPIVHRCGFQMSNMGGSSMFQMCKLFVFLSYIKKKKDFVWCRIIEPVTDVLHMIY
ncbi:unnamed protein product [Strongylus vulgaris]|uniref:Uncharacterized protein n=1 Tax=Strongylus vulgaris TaxID=40348 RepID=A0A3P7IW69_STRVU|nr:unnamed protein product [Strongylus vulgaris]